MFNVYQNNFSLIVLQMNSISPCKTELSLQRWFEDMSLLCSWYSGDDCVMEMVFMPPPPLDNEYISVALIIRKLEKLGFIDYKTPTECLTL